LAETDALWAKLGKGDAAGQWQPLICHLIDVGAVAERIWEQVCSPSQRAWLARSLGLPGDAVGPWLAFVVGLHDLGKAGPVFQLQAEPGASRVAGAGFPGERPSAERLAQAPHATVTQATLGPALQGVVEVSERVVRRLAEVLGGHHGAFPKLGAARTITQDQVSVGGTAWAAARTALVRRLVQGFGVPVEVAPTAVPGLAASMWLAGLVSVADWIGSDTRYFPLIRPPRERSPGRGIAGSDRTRAISR